MKFIVDFKAQLVYKAPVSESGEIPPNVMMLFISDVSYAMVTVGGTDAELNARCGREEDPSILQLEIKREEE